MLCGDGVIDLSASPSTSASVSAAISAAAVAYSSLLSFASFALNFLSYLDDDTIACSFIKLV